MGTQAKKRSSIELVLAWTGLLIAVASFVYWFFVFQSDLGKDDEGPLVLLLITHAPVFVSAAFGFWKGRHLTFAIISTSVTVGLVVLPHIMVAQGQNIGEFWFGAMIASPGVAIGCVFLLGLLAKLLDRRD